LDLFESGTIELRKKRAPLADRMRPITLDQFIGQEHIIGRGRLLRRAIEIDQLSSIILYGPPGTGKTTLARIIANTTKSDFLSINAVLAGVKDIRDAIEKAQSGLRLYSKKTILFVDEVHRFNKAQQDALLPHVENGTITLIGATTENPYFEVNKALVSRSRIFQLRSLDDNDLRNVLSSVLKDVSRGYGSKQILIDENAIDHLCRSANGDARSVLNALELAVETTSANQNGQIVLTREIVEESIQKKAVLYDKDGDAHYDVTSAFIKSLRGSDPDASLYWLAKMIYAGEDPKFIFRRMAIFAAEDVGMADPQALAIVMAAMQTYEFIGMPEGRFPLSQACIYLATAEKSNTTLALFDALKSVEKDISGDVPDHLKDSSRDRDGFGHGEGYLYPHAYRDHWVAQQYLPSELQGKLFYNPSDQGYELSIRKKVIRNREVQIAELADNSRNNTFMWQGTSWEQRSSEGRGGYYNTLREILFENAGITSESLVLDCNCETAFFAAEAMRIVKTGGLWAVARTLRDYELSDPYLQCEDSFSKPHLISRGQDLLSNRIATEAGGSVVFDRIIGRNLSQSDSGRADLLELGSILAKNGEIHLVEHLALESSTLGELCGQTEYANILQTIENDIHGPKANENVEKMYRSAAEQSGLDISIRKEKILLTKGFSRKTVQSWFRTTVDGSSLGDRIEKKYSPEIRCAVEKTLIEFFSVGEHPWYQCVAFIRMRHKRP